MPYTVQFIQVGQQTLKSHKKVFLFESQGGKMYDVFSNVGWQTSMMWTLYNESN